MNEVNETNQANKTLIDLFSNNLKELSIKYTKVIAKNDIGGGLNILKNIEMVIKIIRDIQENENLSVILDDVSTVWESIDNTEEIVKTIGGTRNKEVVNVCMQNYNNSADELAEYIRRDFPKTLANKLSNNNNNNNNNKTNNERGNK